MIPAITNMPLELPGIPRESGDDPVTVLETTPEHRVFPARAGMIRAVVISVAVVMSIPRESGDDPYSTQALEKSTAYSPRERG